MPTTHLPSQNKEKRGKGISCVATPALIGFPEKGGGLPGVTILHLYQGKKKKEGRKR